MIDSRKVLAVIPARGGSKGLPGKNIMEFAGKPLLAWSIEAARASRYIDRLILSSEDEGIIAVAKRFGCEVPFRRPSELATDAATADPVLIHALDHVGESFDYVVLLQPTSPLRTAGDIDGAISLCYARNAPACVSMSEVSKPPEWMYRPDVDDRVKPLLGDVVSTRRQDLAPALVINGAVYVARVEWYRQHRTFLGPDTVVWRMSADRSIDIDSRLDLLVAQTIVQAAATRSSP